MHIYQVLINDDSDRTITGLIVYDRDNGGSLTIPAGTAFPAAPVSGEVFWRTDLDVLYRRDDGNTAWNPIQALPTQHASTHLLGGSDELDGDQVGIDYTPSNYTPTTSPAVVTDLDHLSAHLAGLDAALGGIDLFVDLAQVSSTSIQTVTSEFVNGAPPNGLFLRHNFNVVITQAGTFRLDYSYLWNHDATNSDFIAQIVQGSTLLYRHIEEPKDSAGGSVAGSGSSQILPASGFVLLTLNPNTYNFQLQFGTSDSSDESTLFRSDLMFYRVI